MKSKRRQSGRKFRKSLRSSKGLKKHHRVVVRVGDCPSNHPLGMIIHPEEEQDTRSIHHLSQDLLSEILKRLHVKYILRCMSVHKSWYSLIHTPLFITLHLLHQKTQHSPKYLLFRNSQLTLRFDDVRCQEYCRVNNLDVLRKESSCWSVHSYGLICVTSIFNAKSLPSEHQRGIYLWNPLLEKFITLPDSPLYTGFTFEPSATWTALAFGFVPHLNDYILVHIMKNPLELNSNTVVIGLYSLKTNSWKITCQDHVFITRIYVRQVVFVNGAAYWVGCNSTRRIVMCFDTKTNLLREIALPFSLNFDRSCSHQVLHPYGQSVSYFVEDDELTRFDVWVLREDLKNEFIWEKKMSVDLGNPYQNEALGVRNNGDPIFFRLLIYKFITYNLRSHKADDFVISWGNWDDFLFQDRNNALPYSITPFVESLVLLNNDVMVEQNIKSKAFLVDMDS